MSCARTMAKRSISVRWSAVSPRVQRRAAIVAAWLAPGSMARAIRPAASVSSQRERGRTTPECKALRLRSRFDSGVVQPVGARPGVHHAQLDGARVDRADRQRAGHGPQPEGGRPIRRHVEPGPAGLARRARRAGLGERRTPDPAAPRAPACARPRRTRPRCPRRSGRRCGRAAAPAARTPCRARAVRASSTCGSGSSSRSAAPTAPASTPACARNASNCSDVMPRLLASRATPIRSRPGAAAPGRALHPAGAPRATPAARRAAASAPARAACRGGCARPP